MGSDYGAIYFHHEYAYQSACRDQEADMNKDRVKGKVKDIAGRAQRQAGEWTGDEESQIKGAEKQAEGKVQNLFGKAKDAMNKPRKSEQEPRRPEEDEGTERESESDPPRRRA
jgi:uncharacterized protein YjbJ (UPF0337 family)